MYLTLGLYAPDPRVDNVFDKQMSEYLLMDMPWANSSFTRPLPYISDKADWASLTRPALKAARPSWAMVRLYRI